jgi:S-DNA-T family DNA segregation ATPase FtsK/SpoIIIE
MASRKTRKKTSTRRKASSTRRKTTRKRTQARGRSVKGKTKSRGSTRRKSAKSKAPSIQSGISADRKMEIIGILLAMVGLLTGLSLLSSNPSSITGAWTSVLLNAFGWGVYFFPLALILVGLWIVLKNFERIPQLAVERLVGIFFLFLLLLVFLHLWVSPLDRDSAVIIADNQQGGGHIGAALMVLLIEGLGTLGMVIALSAWLLLALALTLDIPVTDLFRWVPPLILRIQDAWDEWRAEITSSAHPPEPEREIPPMPEPPTAESSMPSSAHRRTATASITEVDKSALPLPHTVLAPREWVLPVISDILDKGAEVTFTDETDQQRAQLIEDTLSSFGAPATVVEINRGPTITQFGVEPDFIETRSGRTRVRVGKIASLADDLSLALAASRIRIQAPVPGKGYVGIEVPNAEIALVALRDVIESQAFKRLRSPLRFALGQDVAGNAVAADLAAMPHLLVAGATGSGKSVCVNAFINCLLLNNTPETLRIIMIDPKRVELTGYNGIPHLLAPVVTEIDRVVGVLQWVTRQMDNRYQKFADSGARNIADYNNRVTAQGNPPLPFLIVVIDELADLMMISPDQTERLITRMAQLARATGIHLVISTQRPSVDVVTGLIKANFPARISFAVASGTDSRVVLDNVGAERLLGRGDMLFQAPDAPAPVRLQGVFVSDSEILRTVQYWRSFGKTTETAPVPTSTPLDAPPPNVPLKQMPIWDEMKEEEDLDPMFPEAVDYVRRKQKASISMLQRRLRIGYTRAARMIETMEEKGIIGPATGGSKPRQVLDYGEGERLSGEE